MRVSWRMVCPCPSTRRRRSPNRRRYWRYSSGSVSRRSNVCHALATSHQLKSSNGRDVTKSVIIDVNSIVSAQDYDIYASVIADVMAVRGLESSHPAQPRGQEHPGEGREENSQLLTRIAQWIRDCPQMRRLYRSQEFSLTPPASVTI